MLKSTINLHTKRAFPAMSYLNSLCSHSPASMELGIGVAHSDSSPADAWFSSDTSSGYLEDAVAGWVIWCNQQSSPSYSQDQKVHYTQKTHYLDDHVALFTTCSSTKSKLLDDYCFADCQKFSSRSQSSSQNDMHAAAIIQDTPPGSWACSETDRKDAPVSKGHWKKVAYPFELVKPGGVEGETTLKDINHQMLMSPTKPIPHPVGDSATHPCISARSLGITGKAVVALTRIHTQGRGSITIVRTKG